MLISPSSKKWRGMICMLYLFLRVYSCIRTHTLYSSSSTIYLGVQWSLELSMHSCVKLAPWLQCNLVVVVVATINVWICKNYWTPTISLARNLTTCQHAAYKPQTKCVNNLRVYQRERKSEEGISFDFSFKLEYFLVWLILHTHANEQTYVYTHSYSYSYA